MFDEDTTDKFMIGNHFTKAKDVLDIDALVREAIALKDSPWLSEELGQKRTLGLVFFNPSLRTSWSTQKAGSNLGMDVIIQNIRSDAWNLEFKEGAIMDGDTQEHIKDAVAVLSGYCDILGIRCFAGLQDRAFDYGEHVLNQFVGYSSVPVVSLESATRHPLQSLADLVTISEHSKSKRPRVVLSWAPHPKCLPQAVPNSFAEWSKAADLDLVITHPPGYELAPEFSKGVEVEYDQNKAFDGAEFVYVKNWSSYENYGQRLEDNSDWIVDGNKMQLTREGKFMHCLPIRRNVVATDEVVDGNNSLVLQQAQNRIFATQAVLKQLIHNIESEQV